MSDNFLGEIQLFGFDYAPVRWAFANGATLGIAQNTALFSLIGTVYGGNGKSTFSLPNLAGRAACQAGQGPGLTERVLGETFGATAVTLIAAELPAHQHALTAFSQPDVAKRSGAPIAGGGLSFLTANASARTFAPGPQSTTLAPTMLAPAGGTQPHENRQPYLAVNFCIALAGIFPPRP